MFKILASTISAIGSPLCSTCFSFPSSRLSGEDGAKISHPEGDQRSSSNERVLWAALGRALSGSSLSPSAQAFGRMVGCLASLQDLSHSDNLIPCLLNLRDQPIQRLRLYLAARVH